MDIKITRRCIDAILDGSVNDGEFNTDPYFGLDVPKEIKGILSTILNPRESWDDKDEYDRTAHELSSMFRKNYKQYKSKEFTDYTDFGPIAVRDK